MARRKRNNSGMSSLPARGHGRLQELLQEDVPGEEEVDGGAEAAVGGEEGQQEVGREEEDGGGAGEDHQLVQGGAEPPRIPDREEKK